MSGFQKSLWEEHIHCTWLSQMGVHPLWYEIEMWSVTYNEASVVKRGFALTPFGVRKKAHRMMKKHAIGDLRLRGEERFGHTNIFAFEPGNKIGTSERTRFGHNLYLDTTIKGTRHQINKWFPFAWMVGFYTRRKLTKLMEKHLVRLPEKTTKTGFTK